MIKMVVDKCSKFNICVFSFSLEILSKWPLFGSSFFAVKRVPEGKEKGADHILALNRHGVHFIDLITHVSRVSVSRDAHLFT